MKGSFICTVIITVKSLSVAFTDTAPLTLGANNPVRVIKGAPPMDFIVRAISKRPFVSGLFFFPPSDSKADRIKPRAAAPIDDGVEGLKAATESFLHHHSQSVHCLNLQRTFPYHSDIGHAEGGGGRSEVARYSVFGGAQAIGAAIAGGHALLAFIKSRAEGECERAGPLYIAVPQSIQINHGVNHGL